MILGGILPKKRGVWDFGGPPLCRAGEEFRDPSPPKGDFGGFTCSAGGGGGAEIWGPLEWGGGGRSDLIWGCLTPF